MSIPKRRRNNKQKPFFAFNDGKIYAANRKARRMSLAKKVVVKENNLTQNNIEDKIFEGENNGVNDNTSI